jgi:hypothetical protein
MNNASDQFIPGYKQPWFWFLMVPLIMVFIMGFTMLYLSISTSDGVVVDNFYKDGLAIKTRNEQDAAAADLGLAAQVTINGRQIHLELSGVLDVRPARLTLHFIYPTKSSEDLVVVLVAADNGYAGALPEALNGRYQVMLSPQLDGAPGAMWRLHGMSHFPLTASLALKPK